MMICKPLAESNQEKEIITKFLKNPLEWIAETLEDIYKNMDDAFKVTKTGDEMKMLITILHFSNKEIASKLFISPATIQTHRANIMSKLNLHKRTELIKYAISHGLIKVTTNNWR